MKTAVPQRDLAVDYYRVSGVVLIVIGHWLLSCVTYHDGSFGLQDPLADIPWTRWITWPLQAVPVFFLAAGYASAVSWQHWCDRGGDPRQTWVRNRLCACSDRPAPTWLSSRPLIVTWPRSVLPGTVLEYAGWAVAMQLWFLAVYVLVVYLTPIAIAAQRHWGLWPAAVLGLGVIVMNSLEIAAHVPYVSWMNYLFCWGALYQLGIAWQGGLLTVRRAVPLAVAFRGGAGISHRHGTFPGVDDLGDRPDHPELVAAVGGDAGVRLRPDRTGGRVGDRR